MPNTFTSSATCVPTTPAEPVKTETVAEPIQTEAAVELKRTAEAFNVLDLTRVIEIYAESQATEEFDAKMREEKTGAFKKLTGFFARSFQRMGRGAWIDSRKRALIEDIKAKLKDGTYTEEYLINHITSGIVGIENTAYMGYEELIKDRDVPAQLQKIADEWLAAPPDSAIREAKTAELKATLETYYPQVTTSLDQLEHSLLKLEQAMMSKELEAIEMKLNLLDIGRIERGSGDRTEGWFVRTADKMDAIVNGTRLPDWFKQKCVGIIRHPNTAAVATALLTRGAIGTLTGATVATFAGGFLLPIIVGASAGGLLAGVRAKREMRDRTNQIDRRGATGYLTGDKSVDGKSSHTDIHDTRVRQSRVDEAFNALSSYVQSAQRTDTDIENALAIALCYMIRHKVGRETNVNLLQFSDEKSVSRQHVEMLRMIDQIFPGLKTGINDGSLFDTNNDSAPAEIAQELYAKFHSEIAAHMDDRSKVEQKYAVKQGVIYGGVALVAGATIQGVLSMFSTPGHMDVQKVPGGIGPSTTTLPHYPGNLNPTHIVRGSWFDNGTPAPVFDGTELKVHVTKAGDWSVKHMLGNTATSSNHHLPSLKIDSSLFENKSVQALVTPKAGAEPFLLSIRGDGTIDIPAEFKDAFDHRTFHRLEIVKTHVLPNGSVHVNAIATVKGAGAFVFDKVTEVIPGKPLPDSVTERWVDGTTPYWGIPFGATPYHELKERKSLYEPKTPPEKEDQEKTESPIPPASPTPDKPLQGGATAAVEPKPEPTLDAAATVTPPAPKNPKQWDENTAAVEIPELTEVLEPSADQATQEAKLEPSQVSQEATQEISTVRDQELQKLYDSQFGDHTLTYQEATKQYPETQAYLETLEEILVNTETAELYKNQTQEMTNRVQRTIRAFPSNAEITDNEVLQFVKWAYLKSITPDEKLPINASVLSKKFIIWNPLYNTETRESIFAITLCTFGAFYASEKKDASIFWDDVQKLVNVSNPEDMTSDKAQEMARIGLAIEKRFQSQESSPSTPEIDTDELQQETSQNVDSIIKDEPPAAVLGRGRLPMLRKNLEKYTTREITAQDVRSTWTLTNKTEEKFYPQFITFEGKRASIVEVTGLNGFEQVKYTVSGQKDPIVQPIQEFVSTVNEAIRRWQVILKERTLPKKKRA